MARPGTDSKILLILLAGVFILMSIASPRNFLKLETFQGMAFQLPELGMLSLAMMLAMLTGGINLSIIATANISSITAALILQKFVNPDLASKSDGLWIALAILAALAVSAAFGVLNGILIAGIEIPPILATLGTMKLLQGLALIVTKGYVLSGMPAPIMAIGNNMVAGIPIAMLVFVVFLLLLAAYLNHTSSGFKTFLLGSNSVATNFAGIDNVKIVIRTYMISGIYSGIAGIIMLSRFNSAKAGYGESYLLVTVLACVLGGIKSEGGFGGAWGLFLSLVVLQMLSSGLNLLGASSFLTLVIWGTIMIVVMLVQNVVSSRTPRRRGIGLSKRSA